MNEYITLAHKLPNFNVTAESEWKACTSGGHIIRTPGIIIPPTPEYDDEYYFLKLMDASRRPYYKPVSHKFLQ